MSHPRKVNRVITQHPFTLTEQRLCLTLIRDLRERFRGMRWSEIKDAYRYLSAISGIRVRICGKEARP